VPFTDTSLSGTARHISAKRIRGVQDSRIRVGAEHPESLSVRHLNP
jgi:hypothetical protein